ncbi:hypothetical protein C8R42DRAFT_178064 [Lentinula raphanica]|nr:hypothetical protein C8R42DRAFT_178064 [Lentinula raphanica]
MRIINTVLPLVVLAVHVAGLRIPGDGGSYSKRSDLGSAKAVERRGPHAIASRSGPPDPAPGSFVPSTDKVERRSPTPNPKVMVRVVMVVVVVTQEAAQASLVPKLQPPTMLRWRKSYAGVTFIWAVSNARTLSRRPLKLSRRPIKLSSRRPIKLSFGVVWIAGVTWIETFLGGSRLFRELVLYSEWSYCISERRIISSILYRICVYSSLRNIRRGRNFAEFL